MGQRKGVSSVSLPVPGYGSVNLNVIHTTSFTAPVARAIGGMEMAFRISTKEQDPLAKEFQEYLEKEFSALKASSFFAFTEALETLAEKAAEVMKDRIRTVTARIKVTKKRKIRDVTITPYKREVYYERKPPDYAKGERLIKHIPLPPITVKRPVIVERREIVPSPGGHSTGALLKSISWTTGTSPGATRGSPDASGGKTWALIGPQVGPQSPKSFASYKDPQTGISRAKRPPMVYGKYVDKGSRHFHKPVHYTEAAAKFIKDNYARIVLQEWKATKRGKAISTRIKRGRRGAI